MYFGFLDVDATDVNMVKWLLAILFFQWFKISTQKKRTHLKYLDFTTTHFKLVNIFWVLPEIWYFGVQKIFGEYLGDGRQNPTPTSYRQVSLWQVTSEVDRHLNDFTKWSFTQGTIYSNVFWFVTLILVLEIRRKGWAKRRQKGIEKGIIWRTKINSV